MINPLRGPIGKKEIVSARILLCLHEMGVSSLARLVTCLLFPPDLHAEVAGGGWGVATETSTPSWHVTSASQWTWGYSFSGCVVFQAGKEERCIEVESKKRSQRPRNFVLGPCVAAGEAGMLLQLAHRFPPTVWGVPIRRRMGLGRPRAVAASERKHSTPHCSRKKQELSPREFCEL